MILLSIDLRVFPNTLFLGEIVPWLSYPMTFHDLQQRLLDELRQRVRSGATTERSLARLSGISQPHLHNVLKGKRLLSMEKADTVLHRLHIDVLNLIEPEELRESIRRR